MLTQRDRNVILSVGKHKALSKNQILKVSQYFSSPFSYSTYRRRMRRELENNYLSKPFRWFQSGANGYEPLYRLTAKGAKVFREMTGREYNQPTWSENYIPHLLQTNDIILQLYDLVRDLWLEWRPEGKSKVQLDALLELESKRLALEVDIGTETREQIQGQFLTYQKELKKYNLPRQIVFVSNRPKKVRGWCKEVVDNNVKLSPQFVASDKISKLKSKLEINLTGVK